MKPRIADDQDGPGDAEGAIASIERRGDAGQCHCASDDYIPVNGLPLQQQGQCNDEYGLGGDQ